MSLNDSIHVTNHVLGNDLKIASEITQTKEPQILLILVGLPGSGKTTFSEALVHYSVASTLRSKEASLAITENGNDGQQQRLWVRASQDDAPNRRRQECEAVVRRALREGHNVVVDRVGFDAVQRSHFIQIANEYDPPPKIYCLVLQTSRKSLESRLIRRPYHPTLHDAETALRVLGHMQRSFQPPNPSQGEGFDRIYILAEGDQAVNGDWTEDGVWKVLHDLAERGQVESSEVRDRKMVHLDHPPIHHGFRGGYNRDSYGRGDYGRNGFGNGGHGYRGNVGRGGYGRGRGYGSNGGYGNNGSAYSRSTGYTNPAPHRYQGHLEPLEPSQQTTLSNRHQSSGQ